MFAHRNKRNKKMSRNTAKVNEVLKRFKRNTFLKNETF
jgi:hypothetical protein